MFVCFETFETFETLPLLLATGRDISLSPRRVVLLNTGIVGTSCDPDAPIVRGGGYFPQRHQGVGHIIRGTVFPAFTPLSSLCLGQVFGDTATVSGLESLWGKKTKLLHNLPIRCRLPFNRDVRGEIQQK